MAISITTSVTGQLDQSDRRAMEAQIDLENERRAALDPPGTPLTYDTATNRKNSYEAVLNERMIGVHQSYVDQANQANADVKAIKEVLPTLSNATLAQIKTLAGL